VKLAVMHVLLDLGVSPLLCLPAVLPFPAHQLMMLFHLPPTGICSKVKQLFFLVG
jgi:hypothetical protein